MTIRIKRIYEDPAPSDGLRILVDRLWPRGIAKKDAKLDYWAKDIAPSNELRQWYGHDAEKWPEFKRRFEAELEANKEAVDELLARLSGEDTVTFLFGSKESELNNAAALRDYVEGGQ